eukprot:g14946.t1
MRSFLLVGEVLAQIAASFSKDPRTRTGDASDTVVDPDNILAAARAPFADFVQEPWWDVAMPRDGNSPEDAVDTAGAGGATSLSGTLGVLCEESSAFLRSACALALEPLPAPLELALGAEGFARVVGMFEQNNVGVRAPSPIPAVVRELLEKEEEEAVVDRHALRGAARREVRQEAAGLLLEMMGEEDECGDEDEDDEDAEEIVSKSRDDDDGDAPGGGGGGRCHVAKGGERTAEMAGMTGSTATAASGRCAGDDGEEGGEGVRARRTLSHNVAVVNDKRRARKVATTMGSAAVVPLQTMKRGMGARPRQQQQRDGEESDCRDSGGVTDPLVAELGLL